MEICPVNREWIHTYVLEPYLQGAALLNRAWKGVDFYSLARTPLSLKERAINWLTGMALMVPFVNTIIWLAWQTFGSPEKLFNPYSPEAPLPPTPAPVHPIQILSPVAAAQPQGAAVDNRPAAPQPNQPVPPANGERPTERFAFNESGDNTVFQTNWRVEHHPTVIMAQQNCPKYTTNSIYNPTWGLQEFHYVSDEFTCDLWLTDPKHIRARLVPAGDEAVERTLELNEAIPWIQQPTLGFKSFILSNETEMTFYAVMPKKPIAIPLLFPATPFLMKATARKVGEEDLPGYGRLIKVEVRSAWGWPFNLKKAELWYDRQTGALRKFIDPGFITRRIGEFSLTP